MLAYYQLEPKKYLAEIANLYHTIGLNYGVQGNRTDEQRWYRNGLQLLELVATSSPGMLQTKNYLLGLIYNSLSISFFADNRFEAALTAARKSLSYRNLVMPGSEQLAINWMIIGRSLYQTNGNADTALFYLDKSLAILEKKRTNNNSMEGSNAWTTYKGYKAAILLAAGRVNEAIAETTSTIQYIEQHHPAGEQQMAGLIYSYCSLSEAYLQQGKKAEALRVMETITAQLNNKPEVPVLSRIKMKVQYAVTLSRQQQWKQAKELYAALSRDIQLDASQIARPSYRIPVTFPFEFINVYEKAAGNLVSEGLATRQPSLLQTGITMLQNIAASIEARKAWYFEAGVDEGMGSEDFGVYDDLLNALYHAKGLMKETDRLRDAFAAIESSKANLLKSALLEDNYLSAILPPDSNNLRNDLKTNVYAAIKNSRQLPAEALQDSVTKAKEAYLSFLQQVRKHYPQPATFDQQLITASDPLLTKHDGAIVNYFLGKSNLFVFIHQSGKQLFLRKDLLPGFELLLAPPSIKTGASTAKQPHQKSPSGQQLFNWLLQDVQLEGELVIIPHRQLSRLSFEMINTNNSDRPQTYVINKCAVRYAYAASLMQASPVASQRKHSHAFFGGFAATRFNPEANADFQNPSPGGGNSSIVSLARTGKEVQTIASLLGGDAFIHTSPADFLQHAARYRILHIATHAVVDEDNGQNCNFLFERDTAGHYEVSDGEIASLPLQADMAVLSACKTGLGKMNNNEGMISLGRSFFIAGCPSVVMSLWVVNDESTATIMTSFYEHLTKGEAKDEALRNAKLSYLAAQTNPAKKDPYYWAGFVVVGDNEALQNGYQPYLSGWILVTLVMISLLVWAFVYWRRRSRRAFT